MREVRKIAENPNQDIKGNQEEEKNRFTGGAKKIANGAKNAAIKLGKAGGKAEKGLWKIILTHLPICIIIIIIILIILYVLAFYGFVSSMPGMFIGQIKKESKSFFHILTDWIWTYLPKQETIDKDEVKDLAQYLENMGYSIVGNGFADVTYEDNSGTKDPGKTKTIKKVTDRRYIHNNLEAYMLANEATYDLAQNSLGGMAQDLLSDLRKLLTGEANLEDLSQTTGADYSSGLINIAGLTSKEKNDIRSRCEINREKETLVVYTDSKPRKVLKVLGIFSGSPQISPLLNAIGRLKFGTKYTYDLSDWTAKYGRPTEMFISLHLATMMPDLVYQIATAKEFNTKVDLQFQEATVELNNITVDNKKRTSISKRRNRKCIS